MTWGNQTRARDSETYCTHCTRLFVVYSFYSVKWKEKSLQILIPRRIFTNFFSLTLFFLYRWKLTMGSRWKITTRPPLSPVARRSPSWLNSTHEIISAETETNVCWFTRGTAEPFDRVMLESKIATNVKIMLQHRNDWNLKITLRFVSFLF